MRRYLVLLIMFMMILISGCSKETIKIGFIVDLSSNNSQLAMDAKNAILLGIDELNDAGGVNGKNIELVTKKYSGGLDEVVEIHDSFIDEGVHYVIGHLEDHLIETMTTSQGEDLMFITPSISSLELKDKDDYIVQIAPMLSQETLLVSQYLKQMGIRELTLVYDTGHEVYSEVMKNSLMAVYEDEEHKIKTSLPFDLSDNDLDRVINDVLASGTKNLLLIAQPSETSYLIRTLKSLGADVNIYALKESMTDDIIASTGPAIENTIFVGAYVPEELPTKYLVFKELFKDKFNEEPSDTSILAYDALSTLIMGLESANDTSPLEVKKAILGQQVVGLLETYLINEYGDNDREYLLYKVVDGIFEPMRDWREQ